MTLIIDTGGGTVGRLKLLEEAPSDVLQIAESKLLGIAGLGKV